MLRLASKLSSHGVLSLNRRNLEFIAPYNKRTLFPLVDDKLRTKRLAEEAGIAVPELYAVVKIPNDINRLPQLTMERDQFVMKPTKGSGGEGVLVVTGRSKELYRAIDGTLIELAELKHHAANILSGMFSLGGRPDQAMIEYRVEFDPIFEKVSYLGVPDIRIIVFIGVPVMAMVRLPTRLSHGKANLHQGAIGAGISIRTGQTLHAVWQDSVVDEHPDTGHPVCNIEIPQWRELLTLAARCYELTGLGYIGVDIVLDHNKGPMILELNARPGLSIQIANRAGLVPRLELTREYAASFKDIESRVRFAMERF